MDVPQTTPASNNIASKPQSPRSLDAWRIALLALAALALGAAIGRRDGLFSQGALFWLNVAAVSSIVAMLPLRLHLGAWQQYLPVAVLLGALAFQFTTLYQRYPGTLWNAPPGDPRKELSIKRDDLTWIRDSQKLAAARQEVAHLEAQLTDWRFRTGILLAASLSLLCLIPWRPARYLAIPLLLLLHFSLGVWLLHKTSNPFIDVYVFQQESCAALLHGQNPYATTFTNIYGDNAYVYAPDLMKDGRVNFGYPYTPLSLFLTLPGYLIMGDHRYSQLAALTLAGAFLFFARPGLLSALATLLLLCTPRAFMIIEMGWTEPFVVLLLAATLFCACRFPRATPYALGLLLASKQYTVFLIPLAALLLRRFADPNPRSTRDHFPYRDYFSFLLKAFLVAAAISLPLVLWNLNAFLFSAVKLQLIQPFRKDSISYLAWFAWVVSEPWAIRLAGIAFFASLAAIIVALRNCPHSPQGFAAATAFVYLAFLALNKQAFCNYYFLVIAAFASAVALSATSPAAPAAPASEAPAPQ
ncbi:MAG: hypothetical protein ACM359_11865 [Bacillota bacterium]